MLPLSGSTIAGRSGPYWTHYTVAETDFTAAAAFETIALFTLPIGGVIHSCVIKHSASFTGGTISDYTLEVGKTGNEDKYSGGAALDVFQAPAGIAYLLAFAADAENFAGAVTINVTARCASDDVADATAGAADIYVLLSEPLLIP